MYRPPMLRNEDLRIESSLIQNLYVDRDQSCEMIEDVVYALT